MKRLFLYLCSFVAILFCFNAPAEGAWTLKDGKLVNLDDVATLSPQEHYRLGAEALNTGNWGEAAKQFHIVSYNFPSLSYGQDANYYLGIAYYKMEEYDLSNAAMDFYLKCQTNPKYFQEAIEYKFCIAEQFRCGAKRRFFGTTQLPKWASGKEIAFDIYDEVIASLPSHEMAAKAFFSKGRLLWQQKDYRESIESFQAVIKRFPKHELTPDSYLLINKIYLEQARREFQNPDLLAFSEINLRKFEDHFPGEERLDEARADVLCIKELYAKGLYDTANFYERIRQPKAAVIYYQKAMFDFPETTTGQRSKRRLCKLCPRALEISTDRKKKENNSEDIEFSGFLELEEEIPS